MCILIIVCASLYMEIIAQDLLFLADTSDKCLHFIENSSSSTPPTPPGEYDAESLLVEQIEAAVSFAVDKLFLHYEIYQFVSFFNQTLAAIGEERQDSKELPTPSQVLELFESSLVPHYASKITDYNFLEAVDYIKTTIFQHFHLYQFLLTQEQPIDLTSLHLPVEVLPSDPLPLTQGIEEEEFKRRERVGKLEEEHALREKELVESQTKAQADLEEKVKKTYKTELAKIQEEEVEGKLISAEELSQIVDSLMSTHLDVMTAKVTHAMQRHALALNSRLEKIEILSSKHSNESLSSSPSKLGPPSPSGKKSRNPSRLSNSTTTS